MSEKKTNAMRILDKAGIAYHVLTYDYDIDDLSGKTAAKHMGIEPSCIFKTLVLRGEGERQAILVCLLPVAATVDLKALARVAGEKRVEPVPVKELVALTGYLRGGCSPIGMKKQYPTFADEILAQQRDVFISAGRRGTQLCLAATDLIAFCHIILGAIAHFA